MISLRVLAVFVVVGCAEPKPTVRKPVPKSYTQLNESPRPMKHRALGSVTLYNTQAPDEKYVEVALLSDVAENESDAIFKLKRSAAGVGCDGIILKPAQVTVVGSRGLGEAEAREMSVSATCIMFVEDNNSWKEPPPEEQDECAVGRARIAQAKSPEEQNRLIKALPTECHRSP